MSRVHVAALAAVLGASSAFGVSARAARDARAAGLAESLHAAVGRASGMVARAAGVDVLSSEGLPLRSASSVGMSEERLATVTRVVTRGITAGGYPGAATVVGRKGAAVIKRGFGRLSWGTESQAVDEHTVYDLASLTKVVGTTTAIMVLYDEGKIDLDAPVRQYLPAFTGGQKDRVTVRQLLTHHSGLPPGRDLWRSARNPEEAREQVLATPLVCRPGECYEYSDLGADVLGFLVETVSGQRLDRFLDERVFRRLGMTDTFFLPPAAVRYRTAPTEVSPPRGYPLKGEVHDENAYALGGVAGHAGLFSTAADLSIYAQMLLNGGEYGGERIVADSTVRLFTERAVGTRGLGWDTCNNRGSCGSLMGASSYGHTGYTGTSLWIDPDRDLFVVLLTNRVHAARAQRPAKVIADVRADLADAAELAVVDAPNGVRAMPASFRADEANGWNRSAKTARGKTRGKHATARSSKSSSRSSKGSTAKKSPSKSATKSTAAKKPASSSGSASKARKK
ncbi:MAG: beta-lactamase family protein [Gemmatirosa sp.]|nr:beta-lactamase family protein [Gemmatirosa sp.]